MSSQDKPTLKVIGAGLSKTSTMSLRGGLERLGLGPCNHMWELIVGDNAWYRSQGFLKAYDGQPVDFRALLDGYQSTLDVPACHFYRELADAFPEAKVILSVREPEAWAKSCYDTIVTWNNGPWYKRPVWFGALPHMGAQRQLVRIACGQFGVKDLADVQSRPDPEVMNRWIDQVKKDIPPERLLIWQVKDGYRPICEFLGLPVLDEPFPRINDTLSMRVDQRCVAVTCHFVTGLVAASVGFTAATAIKYFGSDSKAWDDISPYAIPAIACTALTGLMRTYSVKTLRTCMPIFAPLVRAYLLYTVPTSVAMGSAAAGVAYFLKSRAF